MLSWVCAARIVNVIDMGSQLHYTKLLAFVLFRIQVDGSAFQLCCAWFCLVFVQHFVVSILISQQLRREKRPKTMTEPEKNSKSFYFAALVSKENGWNKIKKNSDVISMTDTVIVINLLRPSIRRSIRLW